MTVSAPAARQRLPRPLKVVGMGLIAFGVLTALLSLGAFRHAASPALPIIRLAIQLAAVIAGIGVLRLHAGLRIVALLWLGLMMALFGLSTVLTFTADQRVLRPISWPAGNVLFCVTFLVLAAICYRILTRPDLQAKFFRGD
jgi:hypothetical protein